MSIAYKEIAERLKEDTPFYARNVLKIADKRGRIVPLEPSRGQITLDAKLEAQRAAGLPMRAIVLKSRQVGMSTWAQAKLIQRATQRENYNCVVVAHDTATGAKLFRIGERMHGNLPGDRSLKPEIAGTRRGRELHFLNGGHQARRNGVGWPDSTYLVDTAGEFQAGRGGTYQAVHCSESAFWDNLLVKLTALKSAVPRHPETLIIIESTANGHNAFKDLWDDAMAGESEYIAFFWPWWKETEYSLPFTSNHERENFRIGDTAQSRFAAGEAQLVDPGPIDTETNEHVPLSLEQLNWRRHTIANECSGSFDMWNQEFPGEPADSFVASARQVFDPTLVRSVLIRASLSDPRNPTPEHPGPAKGLLAVGKSVERQISSDTKIAVPTEPLWVPAEKLTLGQSTEWSFWTKPEKKEAGHFVIGVDVSGGNVDSNSSEPAYHAIEVIDHETHEQVAEYRSRCDPDLLAEQIYLATLMFNQPWVGIEITGGWGLPVIRRMWTGAYRYPFLHFRKSADQKGEKRSDRLGWDTNRKTKPIMEADMAQDLRDGTDGIKSYGLAMELSTYIRHPSGASGPESNKFSDRLLARMIAQQVAREQPIRRIGKTAIPRQVRSRVTGY